MRKALVIMCIIMLRPASLLPPVVEMGSQFGTYVDPHITQAGTTNTWNDDAQFRFSVVWDETRHLPVPFLPLTRLGIAAVGVRIRGNLTAGTSNELWAQLWDWNASAWVDVGLYPITSSTSDPLDLTRWITASPQRFFDSLGRVKLRIANGKALGKQGAPSADAQYKFQFNVLVDCERVQFALPRQRQSPSISGYGGITIDPTGGSTTAGDFLVYTIYDGVPFVGSTAGNATDKRAADLFNFPLADVDCDQAVLEVLTDQNTTSDAGFTQCSLSTDGGVTFTPIFTQSGAITAGIYRADRVAFAPPSDRSLIRFRVQLENATTGSRSINAAGKVIVYYLLKKHKIVRLFPTANPSGQSTIQSGSYIDVLESDQSRLTMLSYLAGQSPPGTNRYSHEIIFSLQSPLVPVGGLVRQINLQLESNRILPDPIFQSPVAIRNQQTSAWQIIPRSPGINESDKQYASETVGGVPGWYFQIHNAAPYVTADGRVDIRIFNDAGLNFLPTSSYRVPIDHFYVEVMVPAPGETDWPHGVDVRGRIIASRLAKYRDPKPAFLQKQFTLGAAQSATITIPRSTGRYLLLTDIYVWSSAKPGDVLLSVLRNDSLTPPFQSLRPQAVVDAPGFMGKILSNINILISPGEEVAIRVTNNSTASADFILYVVGYSWSHINEMEGWSYDALEGGI